MSAQWAPCAINDSPVVIRSRFSLPAPRSSTWMNRKKSSFGKWKLLFALASKQVYQTKVTWFCHEKRQQNWQTHVQFYVETVDQFRSQNGDKQYAAVLNSSTVFKQAATTSSHTPPNPQSPSADSKGYWLLECNVVYSGKNMLPVSSTKASNLHVHSVVSSGDTYKTLKLIQRRSIYSLLYDTVSTSEQDRINPEQLHFDDGA